MHPPLSGKRKFMGFESSASTKVASVSWSGFQLCGTTLLCVWELSGNADTQGLRSCLEFW